MPPDDRLRLRLAYEAAIDDGYGVRWVAVSVREKKDYLRLDIPLTYDRPASYEEVARYPVKISGSKETHAMKIYRLLVVGDLDSEVNVKPEREVKEPLKPYDDYDTVKKDYKRWDISKDEYYVDVLNNIAGNALLNNYIIEYNTT